MRYLKINTQRTKEIVGFTFNIFVTFIILAVVFQLWNKDIHVPIAYQNDGLGAVATIKNMIKGNGIWRWPDWAAPFGDFCYHVDYILPVCIIKIIIIFTHDIAVVVNIFWIITYLLTAITTYLLLRKLKIKYLVAIFGSVIYNFLPYHYFRIEHFWLCGCYVIPLAVWIILDGLELITYEKYIITIGKYKIKKNTVINSLFAFIIGLNGIYYAIFTIILHLIVSFFYSINNKRIKYLIDSVINSIFVFIPIIIFYFIPALLDGGKNLSQIAASRNIADIERYGLRIFLLFFPVQGHRISAFADFTKKYSEILQINNEAFTVVLGAIMSLGLILSILSLFCRKIFKKHNIISQLGLMNLIILFIACTGGMANYIGIFLTSAIRCFNRMSIFIALNSMIVICILLDQLHLKKSLEILLITILTFLGVWDQTSDSFAQYSFFHPEKNEYQWAYTEKEKEYHELCKYFDSIEETVGEGASIYQMPQSPYYGSGNIPFAKIKAYVCSQSLKWTYSDLYGEYKEWQNEIEQRETVDFLNSISLLGMSGILIDKNSYETIEEFEKICKEIKSVCKVKELVDDSGSLYFYNITNYKNDFLHKFSDEDLEVMRDALKDQIDGVDVNYVNMNDFFILNKGKNKDDIISLEADELQHGPYVNLSSGEYRVTILGENLSNIDVRATAGSGTKNIKIKNIQRGDEVLSYDFKLTDFTKDVEFLSKSDEKIVIKGYCYEKKSRQEFHDLSEYYRTLKTLQEKMSYKQYSVTVKAQELFVRSAFGRYETNRNKIELRKNELQYGPYNDLESGKYEVIINGKNLKNAFIKVTSNAGNKDIMISNLRKTDNFISYQVSMDQLEKDVEFLLENRDDAIIEIENYNYKKIEDADFGVIAEIAEND